MKCVFFVIILEGLNFEKDEWIYLMEEKEKVILVGC